MWSACIPIEVLSGWSLGFKKPAYNICILLFAPPHPIKTSNTLMDLFSPPTSCASTPSNTKLCRDSYHNADNHNRLPPEHIHPFVYVKQLHSSENLRETISFVKCVFGEVEGMVDICWGPVFVEFGRSLHRIFRSKNWQKRKEKAKNRITSLLFIFSDLIFMSETKIGKIWLSLFFTKTLSIVLFYESTVSTWTINQGILTWKHWVVEKRTHRKWGGRHQGHHLLGGNQENHWYVLGMAWVFRNWN